MKKEIVLLNQETIGKIKEHKIIILDENAKETYVQEIEKELGRKDINRKNVSLYSGLFCLIVAFLIAILMVLNVIQFHSGEWFTYTFILVGLMIIWVLLYFLFGFILYAKETIYFHFKNLKSSNPDACLNYASTTYFKFMENYSRYLQKTNFVIERKNKKKPILVPFGLVPMNRKFLIFNGKIKSNVPYFYISFQEKRFLFLPGYIAYIDGKNTKMIPNSQFNVTCINNNYTFKYKEEILATFLCLGEFNINFFNFKY